MFNNVIMKLCVRSCFNWHRNDDMEIFAMLAGKKSCCTFNALMHLPLLTKSIPVINGEKMRNEHFRIREN